MYFEEVFIFIIAIVLCIVWHCQKPKNFPPGPKGLPIVGSLPFIKGDLYLYLIQLSKKYGGLFSIQLGNINAVVLNDWKSVKEALVTYSDLFSGRPSVFVYDVTLKGFDIATTTEITWKEQKRFTLQHLRDFGFGKKSMEEVTMNEVNNTINFLDNYPNTKRVPMSELFFAPILSVICKIVTGNTYEINSVAMTELSNAIRNNFFNFNTGALLNFMPYLRFIPGATTFKCFILSHKKVEDIICKETENHIRTYREGEARDFTDVYLAEILKKDEKKNVIFQKDYLNGTLYNLYSAGTETMESTLTYSFLYMALWPEIQQKVQKEIDDIIGRGRLPCYSDRTLLPYTSATILEIQRYATIVPLSVPHAPIANATLMGYSIPKGTFVIQNIYAIHHDKHLWGDPENFRPDRFLDCEGKVQIPEYYIPFSLGARYCLGVSLAKTEMFLFFTCLLQRYSFHCITGEKPPSLKSIVGLTQRPEPYHLTIKKRF